MEKKIDGLNYKLKNDGTAGVIGISPCFRKKSALTIPAEVTFCGKNYVVDYIRENAINGMPNLSTLILPATILEIGTNAITQCPNLRTLHIPAGVAFLSSGFIADCPISHFTVDIANKSYCTYDGAIYTADHMTLVKYPEGKTAPVFTVPEGVKIIDGHSIVSNPFLRSINLPDSVMEIGFCAVAMNPALDAVRIPNTISYISTHAFYANPKLTIDIPATYD